MVRKVRFQSKQLYRICSVSDRKISIVSDFGYIGWKCRSRAIRYIRLLTTCTTRKNEIHTCKIEKRNQNTSAQHWQVFMLGDSATVHQRKSVSANDRDNHTSPRTTVTTFYEMNPKRVEMNDEGVESHKWEVSRVIFFWNSHRWNDNYRNRVVRSGQRLIRTSRADDNWNRLSDKARHCVKNTTAPIWDRSIFKINRNLFKTSRVTWKIHELKNHLATLPEASTVTIDRSATYST